MLSNVAHSDIKTHSLKPVGDISENTSVFFYSLWWDSCFGYVD